MLPCLAKLYSSILNNRIVKYCDKDLLVYKMHHITLMANYSKIYHLYDHSQSCIKPTDIFTSFYYVNFGVKQGDSLSHLLFNLFINDLSRYINSIKCCVEAGIDRVNILLYADAIVL